MMVELPQRQVCRQPMVPNLSRGKRKRRYLLVSLNRLLMECNRGPVCLLYSSSRQLQYLPQWPKLVAQRDMSRS